MPAIELSERNEIDLIMAGLCLEKSEARELENKLKKKSGDLISRLKLLGYYFDLESHSAVVLKSRARHIFWMIENRPYDPITSSSWLSIEPVRKADQSLRNEARRLWLKVLEDQSNNTAILANAALFFLGYDNRLAEDILRKAKAIEPQNHFWYRKLARLYRLERIGASRRKHRTFSQKALREEEEALKFQSQTPTSFQWSGTGWLAFDAGEYSKARKLGRLALTAAKNSARRSCQAFHDAHVLLGFVCLIDDDISGSEKHLLASAVLPFQGEMIVPNLSLARLLLKLGRKRAILRCLKLLSKRSRSFEGDIIEEYFARWYHMVKEGRVPLFRIGDESFAGVSCSNGVYWLSAWT